MDAPDTRNVLDRYKSWSIDLIRDDLKKLALPYSVLMENFEKDNNISCLVRNANFFGVSNIYFLGRKKSFGIKGTVVKVT